MSTNSSSFLSKVLLSLALVLVAGCVLFFTRAEADETKAHVATDEFVNAHKNIKVSLANNEQLYQACSFIAGITSASTSKISNADDKYRYTYFSTSLAELEQNYNKLAPEFSKIFGKNLAEQLKGRIIYNSRAYTEGQVIPNWYFYGKGVVSFVANLDQPLFYSNTVNGKNYYVTINKANNQKVILETSENHGKIYRNINLNVQDVLLINDDPKECLIRAK